MNIYIYILHNTKAVTYMNSIDLLFQQMLKSHGHLYLLVTNSSQKE